MSVTLVTDIELLRGLEIGHASHRPLISAKLPWAYQLTRTTRMTVSVIQSSGSS